MTKSTAERSVDPPATKTAFVISPIGAPNSPEYHAASTVLQYIVKKALPAPEWNVVRADQESAPDSITSHIIRRIVDSELIVADLSGHNPNVFYELAVAHGYSRPVIQIMTEGGTIPFDVKDQRVIYYDTTNPASVDKAISDIADAAAHICEPNWKPRNPLTDFGNFQALSSSGPDGEALAEFIERVTAQMSRLERQIAHGPGPRAQRRESPGISHGDSEDPVPRGVLVNIRARIDDLERQLLEIESQVELLGDEESQDSRILEILASRQRAVVAELARYRDMLPLRNGRP